MSRGRVLLGDETRRTLSQEIARARSRVLLAEGECPHWDFESDGDGHACCDELAAARAELQRLRDRFHRAVMEA